MNREEKIKERQSIGYLTECIAFSQLPLIKGSSFAL